MITSILLPDKDYGQYNINKAFPDKPKSFDNLDKINVFVGANNSGKSRFLRCLQSGETMEFSTPQLIAVDLQWEELRLKFAAIYKTAGTDFLSLNSSFDELRPRSFFPEGRDLYILHKKLFDQIVRSKGTSPSEQHALYNMQALSEKAQTQLTNLIKTAMPLGRFQFKKIYVPTLRGLRPLGKKADDVGGKTDDIYEDRTVHDYFYNRSRPEIFTGLGLYKEVQSLLLGDLKERKIVADFEVFLGNNFFEGKPITLIPKLKSDVLDVKIGDEKEFPIYDLGDGIQSIIILTFPLYKYRDESVLAFFEEPEHYMHPGLQRTFLNVLATEFPNHQFFLTTHSNHFLDLTLDLENVSIYTFAKEIEAGVGVEKTPKFRIENVSNEDFRSLELLGVRNSSVFLSNCTIWVEGVTDRRYLRLYLHLFQEKKNLKEFKEDLHFSFVEYGGGNITHWSFLDNNDDNIDVNRLCGKLFLVCDRDNSKTKGERQNKLKNVLGDRFHCLECREIENLLTPEVLKSVVQKYEGDNVVFNDVAQENYKSTLLGEFIETKMLRNPPKRKGGYKDESGTIKDKVRFCDKALAEINSFDQLSKEAQALTETLYNFIVKNNS